MAANKETDKKLKITLIRSTIGQVPKNRATATAMGLRKINQSVVLPDNAATRGQIQRVRHMELSNLRPAAGSVHSDNFRRGRGHGSGNGKTAGKGHKGQKARSGAPRPGFEGGQMPLYRRIPKRGFKCRNSKEIVAINLGALEVFDNGATVDVDALIEKGIVKHPRDGVKILGNGELTKKLDVKVGAFSASAKEKIEALGGTAEVI